MAVRLAKSALRFKGMHEIVRYDPDGCYTAAPATRADQDAIARRTYSTDQADLGTP